jgi:5-methylthioadenosine/S-adenosylhomocysteine deaminase
MWTHPVSVEIALERWLPRPGREPALRDVLLTVSRGATTANRNGEGKAGGGRLAMPAPVNAHDHGYGIRPLDFGLIDDALEPWIAGLRQRPPTDPGLETLVAFGRVAKSGCGATMHCHNSLNADRLVEEADAVVKAARQVGIRLALSCPLLDDSPFVYGGLERLANVLTADRFQQIAALVPKYGSIDAQLEAVDAIARTYESDVSVQYGLIGPQWCSDRMLERIAAESQRTGRRIHMHLLESPRQRKWLDERFPGGVVRHLDKIGLLTERLAVAHGVQLTGDECELLAERGVTVVTNPTANLRLRSGVAPIPVYRKRGLRFAIGLDGTGFDDRQDIWQELRLVWLLHGERKFRRELGPAELFEAAIENGGAVVGHRDSNNVVVIDYAGLMADAVFDDVLEEDVLLTRMARDHVTDLIVDGNYVLRDGKLTGVDFDAAQSELRDQARAAAGRMHKARADARFLADTIRAYYADAPEYQET